MIHSRGLGDLDRVSSERGRAEEAHGEGLHDGREVHGLRPSGSRGDDVLAAQHAEVQHVGIDERALDAVVGVSVTGLRRADHERGGDVHAHAHAGVAHDQVDCFHGVGGRLVDAGDDAGDVHVHEGRGEELASDAEEAEVDEVGDEGGLEGAGRDDAGGVGHGRAGGFPSHELHGGERREDAEVAIDLGEGIAGESLGHGTGEREVPVAQEEQAPVDAVGEALNALRLLGSGRETHRGVHDHVAHDAQAEDAHGEQKEGVSVTLEGTGLVALHHLGREEHHPCPWVRG